MWVQMSAFFVSQPSYYPIIFQHSLSARFFPIILSIIKAIAPSPVTLQAVPKLCGLSTQRHTHLAVGGFRVLAPKPYLHVSMYTAFH